MNADRIAGVILAAGESRRLGQPKQLVTYRGETLLGRAIRLAREAAMDPVVVVLGAHGSVIRAAIGDVDALYVENDEWQEGMATSMRAGLRAVMDIAPQSAGVVYMPCDQPRLSADHLRAIVTAYRERSVPSIVASVYAGVRAVPALFPPLVYPLLENLSGDRGARSLLAQPPCNLIEVPFEGGDVDIDSPEDLTQLD